MPSYPTRTSRRRLLSQAGALIGSAAVGLPAARAQKAARPEKEALKFGFIKLTDCAPLVVAYEKRFFEDEEIGRAHV